MKRSWIAGLAAGSILMLSAAPLLAATVSWTLPAGQSGDWSTASNWGGTEPASADTAYITNGGTVSVTLPGERCYYLYVGYGGAGSGTVLMTAGSLSVSMYESIGVAGSGRFVQSGGTHSVTNGLNLGNYTGSSGAYNLSGSGLLSANNEYIGVTGSGSFTQSGGTHSVTNSLNLGYNTGGRGTYDLSGSGRLSGSLEYIGVTGSGSFTQSGGTNSVATYVLLGYSSSSSGTYSLSGSGYLSSPTEYVGNSGTGSFTQSGGTNSVTYVLYLGNAANGNGTYNLSGNGYLSCPTEYVGSSGTGSFNQSGGTNRLTNYLYLGYSSSSSGTYDLSGSGCLSSSEEWLGYSGTGSFTQSGGTNTVTNYLYLGTISGGSGTYSLSGSGLLSTPLEKIGNSGTGSFTQSGGTHTVSGSLILAQNAGSSGTYNLNGGLLSAGSLSMGSGSATFNFGGGTLAAGAAWSSPLSMNLTGSNGPATLDTTGGNIGLAGILSGSGDLVKTGQGILKLSGSNTYSGSTTVSGGTLEVTGSLAGNASNKVFVAKDASGVFGDGSGEAVIVRRVAASASYAGLGSTIGNTGSGELTTTVDLLDGTASAQADVHMAWRTRTAAEKTQAGGGLLSEIVDLGGMVLSGSGLHNGSRQTDLFVLQITYDPAELLRIWGLTEADAIQQDMLHVGYLDLGTDATYGTADDRWVRAVDGNFGGTPNFLGNQPYSAGYFSLGNYGVDTANQVVWAVVNHNSQFAAVPEPGTLALLAAGAIGLLTAVRRSKRACHLTCVVAVLLLLPGLARADVFNMAGGLTSLQFVSVDDAGNQADGSGYGAVGYNYRMGKYDVTAAQYTAFLNAVAATDTYGLYSPGQGADLPTIGISRSGSSGSYTYAVIGNGDVPVFDVSWGNAARFANWLHNGQPAGAQGPTTTESGAYELSGGTNTAALMAVTRSATASYFIPSEDEWYKAAYYKSGGTAAGYWTYPTMSNLAPSNVLLLSGSNHANFYSGGYTDPVNFFTSVGAFAASPGPYGTYDMGGDVFQWNEAAVTGSSRGMRGGAYDTVAVTLSSAFRDDGNPASVFTRTGFRVASIEPVPEPGSITLLLAAAVGLLIRRTRRRWKLS